MATVEHARGRRQPRWHRRKEQRPGEIVAAALDLFVEGGYAATKLEDVARRAGVTKGTMYLYFASKEELFKAMVRQTVVPQIEILEQQLEHVEGSTRDLLVSFARGWLERVSNSPVGGLSKLIISEAANFPELASFYHTEVIDRGARVVQNMLRRGIERGEFRKLDVEEAARVLRAPLILFGIWKHSMVRTENCAVDDARYIEAYLDMMLHGLLREPGEERPHA
jgi:AcrR family transcriptional regulator